MADVLESPLEANRYEVISTLATLHHVPLEPALRRLAAALAPGGTLLVLDLWTTRGLKELPRNGVAWLVLRAKRLAQGRPFVPADAERAWNEHGRRDRYDYVGRRSFEPTVACFRVAVSSAISFGATRRFGGSRPSLQLA